MRVISRKTLVNFGKGNPDVQKALEAWFRITKASKWKSPGDVRVADPKASIIANNRVVFDLLGGRYRLVVAVHYSSGVVFIRFVGTHSEYSGVDAQSI